VRRRLASYLAQRGFGMEEIGRMVAEMLRNETK
jgi:SOS response regulatory protein OraA/RecX